MTSFKPWPFLTISTNWQQSCKVVEPGFLYFAGKSIGLTKCRSHRPTKFGVKRGELNHNWDTLDSEGNACGSASSTLSPLVDSRQINYWQSAQYWCEIGCLMNTQCQGKTALIARQFMYGGARPVFGFLPIRDGVSPGLLVIIVCRHVPNNHRGTPASCPSKENLLFFGPIHFFPCLPYKAGFQLVVCTNQVILVDVGSCSLDVIEIWSQKVFRCGIDPPNTCRNIIASIMCSVDLLLKEIMDFNLYFISCTHKAVIAFFFLNMNCIWCQYIRLKLWNDGKLDKKINFGEKSVFSPIQLLLKTTFQKEHL